MSQFDYQASLRISADDLPFYGLVMAAMRQADTANLALLKAAFPGTWAELDARSSAPGGALPGDPGYERMQAARRAIVAAGEPVLLSYDEAVALLPDGDGIDTYIDGGLMLISAAWPRAKILDLLATSERREVTGPAAQSFGHGLAAYLEDGTPVFIKTRQPEMPDAQLDQLLEAAGGDLLRYIKAADPGLPLEEKD